MNQVEIGKFIAQCRKDQKMTQAQLAEMLDITDRAVSKWETGKSMPDSSIMLKLCDILGITVTELLNGKRMDKEDEANNGKEMNEVDDHANHLNAIGERRFSKSAIISIIVSVSLLLAIIICAISDLAITGGITWSTIPISSVAFFWVVSFPIMALTHRRIMGGLISLSVFIIPYLYILSILVKERAVFSTGALMAVVSVVYLWVIFALFLRLMGRKLFASGIAVLLVIPLTLVINIVVSRLTGESLVDRWDFLAIFIMLIAAFACFVGAYAKRRRHG